MKTLNDTLLANLYAERHMAIQSGNALRLAYLDAQIAKVKKEMEYDK